MFFSPYLFGMCGQVCNQGTGASVRVEGEADDSAVGKLRRFIRARLLDEVVESPAKGQEVEISCSTARRLMQCGVAFYRHASRLRLSKAEHSVRNSCRRICFS